MLIFPSANKTPRNCLRSHTEGSASPELGNTALSSYDTLMAREGTASAFARERKARNLAQAICAMLLGLHFAVSCRDLSVGSSSSVAQSVFGTLCYPGNVLLLELFVTTVVFYY